MRVHCPAQFNLELDEVEDANKELERWRRDTGLPLVVEIFLRPWGSQEHRVAMMSGGSPPVETLLERWVFHHQQILPDSPSFLSKSALVRLSPSSIYKRLVILLRSVFALLRTLPAHRLCRAGARGSASAFSLGYRLHSSLPGGSEAPAPSAARGSRAPPLLPSPPPAPAPPPPAPRGMHRLDLTPAETPHGRFRVSVYYQSASAVTVLEQTSSGTAPRIIPDYAAGGRRPRAGAAIPPPSSLALRGAGAARSAADAASPQFGPSGPARGPAAPALGDAAAVPAAGSALVGPTRRSGWSLGAARLSPSRLGVHGTAPGAAAPWPAAGTPPTPRASASLLGSTPPAGRPPLARPPRAGSAGQPVFAPGSLPQQHVAWADEDDGGGPRPLASLPVSIPGCGGGGDAPGALRAPRTAADLAGDTRVAAMPMSAPAPRRRLAVSPSPLPAPEPGTPVAGADPVSPMAFLAPIYVPSESGGSSTTSSAAFPTSCSPSLPFALTPWGQSLGSGAGSLPRSAPGGRLGSAAGTAQQYSMQYAPLPPSSLPRRGSLGGASAGTLSAMRRPSWSSSSLRGSGALGTAGGSGVPTVGYSVSPMQDNIMEALLSVSTPRHLSLARLDTPRAVHGSEAGALSAAAAAGGGGSSMAGSGGGGSGDGATPSAGTRAGDALDDLQDALPFALDSESSVLLGHAAAGPGETGPDVGLTLALATDTPVPATQTQPQPQSRADAPEPVPTTPQQARHDADASVGAFVRMLRDAPPLHRSHSGVAGPGRLGPAPGQLSVAAGIAQLHGLRDRLARQVSGGLV